MNSYNTAPAQFIDQFQRRFTYLRLSITDACNFRCNYCLPNGYCPSGDESPLALTEIEKIVAAFAFNGTKKIRLTGGEPTLRKDLPEIIAACKTTSGIDKVALTSNGYRMTKQLPAFIDAGLDQLNLSADSLRPDTFKLITGQDKAREVLAALEQALALGMREVKLNTVLLKTYNSHELADFFNLVKNLPITLRFIELMNTGDNTGYFNAQHYSAQHIQQQLIDEGWSQIIRGPDAGPALEYSHPDYAGNIGLIMPYSKNFCASCNRLRVSSEGKLHLCLFGDEGLDIRSQLQHASAPELAAHLRQLVLGKQAGHQLHLGNTGHTRHLAMLGG
ncbi:GTP 3',8-cyclase MoaA [Simiduia curdlanivorans]|uniref:GTP 3',8-cyclase n=1 Tax=Simiduia curdlanivorans TaxID=1492769 RepID=A0ABV8V7P6_9GAMM|nr:GTP 3',8-cyclase MoaA [Simiduia curdlanivorans]MDN3640632.1 GTP 3',8-cyclase MoaA [Simiduia curdlanivorans]